MSSVQFSRFVRKCIFAKSLDFLWKLLTTFGGASNRQDLLFYGKSCISCDKRRPYPGCHVQLFHRNGETCHVAESG